MNSNIARAKEKFQKARRSVIFSGAGLSHESGVPTFRGADGLWKQFRAEELATPEAWANDPELVWEWYQWRRELISKCKPNAAHEAIARFERKNSSTIIITQNVDGLLTDAGVTELFELHGNIWMVRCTICRKRRILKESAFPNLPHCPDCKALERPHIVWFGETLDQSIWQKAMRACSEADALLVVGTSGLVFPAAGLVDMARNNEAYICGVNVDIPPQIQMMTDFFQGKAGEWVPQILG